MKHGYTVKIVRDPDLERQQRHDKIVDQVSANFQRELNKILGKERCDHEFFTQPPSGMRICKKCGTPQRYFHKRWKPQ